MVFFLWRSCGVLFVRPLTTWVLRKTHNVGRIVILFCDEKTFIQEKEREKKNTCTYERLRPDRNRIRNYTYISFPRP